MASTLYDKIWQKHVIKTFDNGTDLIYIDRHLVHEVTSPQAFEGLSINNRPLADKNSILATADHNVPTINQTGGITEKYSRLQVEELNKNCAKHNLNYFPLGDIRQGIVHVIGPEQGFTLPGITMVCGDSHTSTHGAFGTLAFGIGTSEIEQVFATNTLLMKKSKNMRITVNGKAPEYIRAKDIILYIIAKVGIAGGTGHVIEYTGEAIRNLSMEQRMTLCNMSIEAGARAGLVAPDQTTFDYLQGRPMAPTGELWDQAVASWKQLYSDDGAVFDTDITIDVNDIKPFVTWGTNPEMAIAVDDLIPDPASSGDDVAKQSLQRALNYMGLQANNKIEGTPIDKVFIGSCTNSRLEDLQSAASVIKGQKKADNVKHVYIVPGSGLIKKQAEELGLDKIFIDAGFDWREPGCSMCLAMNEDKLEPGERCASTSNRNFEGRQGRDGRTHLMSPAMAALAGITGQITNIQTYKG